MARNIPSIDELEERILNNFAAQEGVDASELGDSYIVESKVLAGEFYAWYLKLHKTQNNIYPDLSEVDVLLRYGFAIIDRYPSQATYGEYTIDVLGSGFVYAQTQFVANAGTEAEGTIYITDADKEILGIRNIAIRALNPGVGSTLNPGDKLTSIQPLVGIDNEVTYNSTTVVPVEAETIDSYRDDVLEGIRILPQGGAPGDYRLWTLAISGVRKVYAFVDTVSGDIAIYTESTVENTAVGEVVGVPTQETLDAVYKAPLAPDPESGAVIYDSIKDRGRKPITVNNIYSRPVNPLAVEIAFTGLSAGTYAESIKTALDQLLYEIRPFVAGAQSLRSKNDKLTIGMVTAAVIEVLSGTGAIYTTLTMTVDAVAVNEYTFTFGDYPYLEEVTNDGIPV